MRSSLFCLPLGCGAVLAGCSTPLTPSQYQDYLANPSHGLTQTKEVNGVALTCAYHPTELLVLQDIMGKDATTTAMRDSVARAYSDKTYCVLTFSKNHAEIENQYVTNPVFYQQALAYLNTGIAADTYLVTTSQDSVPAAASMYIRQYGSTGRATVLLVFSTPQFRPTQGFRLTLKGDRLGVGTQRFAFAADDIAALPSLQYN